MSHSELSSGFKKCKSSMSISLSFEMLSQVSPSLTTYHLPHFEVELGGALVGLGTIDTVVEADDDVETVVDAEVAGWVIVATGSNGPPGGLWCI